MAKIPKEWHKYFWEVDPEKVDLAYYVIGRVLDRGNFDAVRQVRRYYGDPRLKEFLLSSYARGLSKRIMRFWQVILDLSPEECERISSIRNKNPLWPY
ncbi:MAG: hypothetical protein ALAOOOJD_04701 [bacterium]|nr:hypothetical protein [bacterium]